jgi:hypothetical protein
MLLAFLPFLLIMLMSMFNGAPVRHYSMVRTSTYPVQRFTVRLRAPFFTNESYGKLSPVEQSSLMTEIDSEYYHILYNECVKEHNRNTRAGRGGAVEPDGWCSRFQAAKPKMQPGY